MAHADFFLKLDSIKGESHDDKHKDEIDVLAWSWSGAQPSSMNVGGGGGVGKVEFSALVFEHYLDKASPQLYLCLANGKHIKSAVLTCRKAGEKPLEYLTVKLTDVLVEGVQTGGMRHDTSVHVHETVSLSFAKVEMSYKTQKADGSADPESTFGWDVKANKKV